MTQIFLSYAREDRYRLVVPSPDWGSDTKVDLCEQLSSAFGFYYTFKLWFDEYLATGLPWELQLEVQISISDALLYLLTPNSADSSACHNEIQIARSKNVTVIPVMLWRCRIPGVVSDIQVADKSDIGESLERICRSWAGWSQKIHNIMNGSRVGDRKMQLLADFDMATYTYFSAQIGQKLEGVVEPSTFRRLGIEKFDDSPNEWFFEKRQEWNDLRNRLRL